MKKGLALLAVVGAFAFGTAGAVPVSGQGAWESTLSARDINSDGSVDAYYDSALNITWLADARAYGSELTYDAAVNWVSQLDVYGVTDWRLPETFDHEGDGCNWSDSGGTDCGYNVLPSSSEMAHMFLVTLGNESVAHAASVVTLTNTGPFQNLQTYGYWSQGIVREFWDPQHHVIDGNAWRFSFAAGRQDDLPKAWTLNAWAVHDGDIMQAVAAPVPEPETYALMLAGLGMVGWVGRRQRQRSTNS